MADVGEPIASKVRTAFQQLAKTSSHLNFVSDSLGKYISEVEEGLKSLNLGVASWVEIERVDHESGLSSRVRELGFDRIGKTWCIGLRSFTSAEWSMEWLDVETWIFNEGPRWLRIKAVDHLPALLEKLNVDAAKISKHVEAKLPMACEVATEVRVAAGKKDKLPIRKV
jgi:hypothetical protein